MGGAQAGAEGGRLTFTDLHWSELGRQGYTIVSGAIDDAHLRAAQDAANELNALYPGGRAGTCARRISGARSMPARSRGSWRWSPTSSIRSH